MVTDPVTGHLLDRGRRYLADDVRLRALATTHHQLKTAGYLDVADSRSDGYAILTTAWGQRIVIPPRAFLDDPEPAPWSPGAPSAPNERPDDPPPF